MVESILEHANEQTKTYLKQMRHVHKPFGIARSATQNV